MLSLSGEAATAAAVTTVVPLPPPKHSPGWSLHLQEPRLPPWGHWLSWSVRLLTCFSFKTSLVWRQETLFGKGQSEAGGGQRCTRPLTLPRSSGCLTGEGSPTEYHGGAGCSSHSEPEPALLMGTLGQQVC